MGNCIGDGKMGETQQEHRSEKTGLLASTQRSAGYSVRRDPVATEEKHSHADFANSAHSGSASYPHPSNRSGQLAAKPVKKFQYLDQKYSMETPSCLIPRLNELFKSVCERYDIAVTNREKVDEALQLFKKVLEVELDLPVVECFRAWRGQLTNPKFTVTMTDLSGDVKKISVRADEVPRVKRKAQKHIHDLLDACHLFLQQRDFLQQQIASDLDELERMMRDIPGLCKGVSLSSSEKKQMPQLVRRARDQFIQFPARLDLFWNQIYSLQHEVNLSVHVLQDD